MSRPNQEKLIQDLFEEIFDKILKVVTQYPISTLHTEEKEIHNNIIAVMKALCSFLGQLLSKAHPCDHMNFLLKIFEEINDSKNFYINQREKSEKNH